MSEYKFASGVGKAGGDMYFGLADEAVINYLLEPVPNEPDENLKQRYEKILQETVQVMGRFIASAEKPWQMSLTIWGFLSTSSNRPMGFKEIGHVQVQLEPPNEWMDEHSGPSFSLHLTPLYPCITRKPLPINPLEPSPYFPVYAH